MTIAAVPSVASINVPTTGLSAPDPDFERRWSEWNARGVAHEARTRSRARVGAAVAGPALLASATYRLFAS